MSQNPFTAIAFMRPLCLAAILSLFASTLQACAGQMHIAQSNALLNGKIKIGMSRGDVVGYLGPPQKSETVGSTEFLFYTPVWYILPWFVGSQNPIAIQNGKVVGMGKSSYDSLTQTTGSIQGAR